MSAWRFRTRLDGCVGMLGTILTQRRRDPGKSGIPMAEGPGLKDGCDAVKN